MDKFEGTPGVWDIDINGQTILSDAGYKVADIDLIHGSDSDVAIMVAAPELLKALQGTLDIIKAGPNVNYLRRYGAVTRANEAIAKALGK